MCRNLTAQRSIGVIRTDEPWLLFWCIVGCQNATTDAVMILDHIYEAATDEAAFLALPGHLAQALGARSAMIQTLTPDFQVERLDFNHFTPEMNAFFFDNQLWEHDLWMKVAIRHGFQGVVRSCDDYVMPDEFRSSLMFNDFL